MTTIDAQSLHRDAIVIDACCPLWYELAATPPTYLDLCKAGGYTVAATTIGGSQNCGQTMRAIGVWNGFIRENPEYRLIRSAQDIRDAKAKGQLGILYHFQGTEPLEDSLDLVDTYKALGVGVIQLAYNTRNRFCDGSEEEGNAGLSRLGRKLIKRMNDARVIVDVSHCGLRTSLEAIEASERTVIFSHANVKAVHDIARNISDEQIKAIAGNGGSIGVLSYPPFVKPGGDPTVDDIVLHIDHIAQLVGIDHVHVAMDYFHYQTPFASDEVQIALHAEMVRTGKWDPIQYTKPPYVYPRGVETPDKLGNLTDAMVRRGYSESDIRKVLGLNLVRIYEDVWGN